MITRRRLIAAGGSVVAGLGAGLPGVVGRSAAKPVSPANPALLPVVDATGAGSFELTASVGETEFIPRIKTPTKGWGRSYLGPIVRVRSGTRVQPQVRNDTDTIITSHWHGLLVPGNVDGGPHQAIEPGKTWNPVLDIDQPPATLWYHTHFHGQSGIGIYSGLAGVLVVEDGKDADRGLPNTHGVDDLTMVLQDKRFNKDGVAEYKPTKADFMHGFVADGIVVNGNMHPTFEVPKGIVRLRFVNAANARNFTLWFEDGRPLVLVGTDQGLLPKPIAMDRLPLSPGERAEVLVDCGEGGRARLLSQPHIHTQGPMMGGGGMHNMVPFNEVLSAPYLVLDLATNDDLPVAVHTIPSDLGIVEEILAEPVTQRDFVLFDMGMENPARQPMPPGQGTPKMQGMEGMAGMPAAGGTMQPNQDGVPVSPFAFAINASQFDMNRVDFEAKAGTVERWFIVTQMMGHPFHAHGVRFRVVSEKGGPPKPNNTGWKDTIFVEEDAELLVQFRHPAAADSPYMLHCHILEHSDAGMMLQFTVT